MAVLELKYDANGLIVAICQDRVTGDIRMVAWMNQAAVERTVQSGRATFYSRSRQSLWTKGETSGNYLLVESIAVDCDRDCLLLTVTPQGPSCHTGSETCFFSSLSGSPEERPAPQFLTKLERELEQRRQSTSNKSYTKFLLESGADKIGDKVREEADEFARAIAAESDERVLNEAADVVYHLLVGLRLRNLSIEQVLHRLHSRSSQSGHEEKANRTGTPPCGSEPN